MKKIDNFKYKTKWAKIWSNDKFHNRTEVTKKLPIGCLLPFISLPLPAATTAARYRLCTLARSGPACKPVGRPASPREQAASKIKPNSNFETNNELRHLLLKLQSFKWCNFLPRLNSKQRLQQRCPSPDLRRKPAAQSLPSMSKQV